jgi:uncharacterized protein (TIGR02996 family)
MTDGEAFLQAIIDSPDDDTPRLVFADWLEDHDQHDRAEFIRVQIELAHLPAGDPRRMSLKRSERKLQEKHEREWAAPLPGLALDWGFHRGFIALVVIPAGTLVKHAEAIFRSVPFTEVRLKAVAGHLKRLASCAYLERLAAIFIEGSLGAGSLRQLLASPHLVRLRTLGLARAGIGTDDLRVVAAWPGLAGLSRLDLADNDLTDQAVEALFASPHLGGLQILDLSGNPIGETLHRGLIHRFGLEAYRYGPRSENDLI